MNWLILGGVLAPILAQISGASRIQPLAILNAHQGSHASDTSPGLQKPQAFTVEKHVQSPPTSDRESKRVSHHLHRSAHPSPPTWKERNQHITMNSSHEKDPLSGNTASLLQANGTSKLALAFEHFRIALAGRPLAQKVIQAGPSVPVRLAVSSFLFVVFATTCCICLSGAAMKGDKQTIGTSGRNQYISKNRVIYEWDQSGDIVTMYTKPPGGITKNSIEVLVWARHLQIGKKGKTPFLKEELFATVDAENSTWRISRSGELEVTLKKQEKVDWPGVMLAHIKKGER